MKNFLARNFFDNIFSFIFWRIYFFTSRIKLKKTFAGLEFLVKNYLIEFQYENIEFSANIVFLNECFDYEIRILNKKFKGFF